MLESVQDPDHLHNQPGWCRECHQFTFHCAHLVEPLGTPAVPLKSSQYTAATWARNILEVTMNTGERFQFMEVPRRLAIELSGRRRRSC